VVAEGAKAQVRLVPAAAATHPASGQQGDLFVGSAGSPLVLPGRPYLETAGIVTAGNPDLKAAWDALHAGTPKGWQVGRPYLHDAWRPMRVRSHHARRPIVRIRGTPAGPIHVP